MAMKANNKQVTPRQATVSLSIRLSADASYSAAGWQQLPVPAVGAF